MNKLVIIISTVIVILSLSFALYQNQEAEDYRKSAIRTENELNTRITELQDSLQLVKKDLEREKQKARELQKISETMSERYKESFDKL